jgi:hypothetical protein
VTVAIRFLGQAACYAAVALLLGYFSSAPAYAPIPPDQALIKLSFMHGAQRRGDCRRLSSEELAKLAPNMRKTVECPRERLPVIVELELDNELLYAATLPPTGLSGDGPSRAYQRFVVPPGRHRLVVRMRDTARTEGFDHLREADIELRPGQNLAIDFNPVASDFILE